MWQNLSIFSFTELMYKVSDKRALLNFQYEEPLLYCSRLENLNIIEELSVQMAGKMSTFLTFSCKIHEIRK